MAGSYRSRGSGLSKIIAGGLIARGMEKKREINKQENREYGEKMHNLYRKQSIVDYGKKVRMQATSKTAVMHATKGEERKTKYGVINRTGQEKRKIIQTTGAVKRKNIITKGVEGRKTIVTKGAVARQNLTHKASLIRKLRKK